MKHKSSQKNKTELAPRDEPPGVGAAVHRLRKQHGLTLDMLAERAGVSKSMLSQIERDLTNPTLATVWRLAQALGTGLEDLVQGTAKPGRRIDLARAQAIPGLTSTDGRCRLRILGPIELAGRFEWYELVTDPHGELVSDAHEPGTMEHLTVLENRLTVESGGEVSEVAAGETVRYPGDQRHAIRNPTALPARAILVVAMEGAARGRG